LHGKQDETNKFYKKKFKKAGGAILLYTVYRTQYWAVPTMYTVCTVDEPKLLSLQISSCTSLHQLKGALNTSLYYMKNGGEAYLFITQTGATSDVFSVHAGTCTLNIVHSIHEVIKMRRLYVPYYLDEIYINL
jgi:hypothetical protein